MVASRMHTPWGGADQTLVCGPGVTQVFTPSHGGYRVDRERWEQMPAHLREIAGEPDGSYAWFEEDCEWAAVVLAFPGYFPAADLDRARETLANWFPAAYEVHFGVKPTAEESYVIRQREFYAAHTDDWVTVSAVGRGDGTVIAAATLGGDRSSKTRRHFLVPYEEYRASSTERFVIDPARHTEITAVGTDA